MRVKDLMERKQKGVEYSIDENNNVIMTFTDFKISYMLKDRLDENENPIIVTYYIPKDTKWILHTQLLMMETS